jgi:1-acyl-sn-glycerol-3-phosphate acyltransferase
LLLGVIFVLIALIIDAVVGRPMSILVFAKLWYQLLLVIMNIKVQTIGEYHHIGTLVASNHVSWLDIPVVGSVLPSYFLSKAEVKKIPILGWLAKHAGTLFIQRGGGQIEETRTLMETYLSNDHCLTFFPEATTGDGYSIRQFHPRLFAAAIDSATAVMPVAIQYQLKRQENLEIGFGDESLVENLWRVLGRWRTDVKVYLLPTIQTAGLDRKTLADSCMNSVADALNIPVSHRNIGFKSELPKR